MNKKLFQIVLNPSFRDPSHAHSQQGVYKQLQIQKISHSSTIPKNIFQTPPSLNYHSIYNNFHLLSYFSPSRQVTILDRVYPRLRYLHTYSHHAYRPQKYNHYDEFIFGCRDETGVNVMRKLYGGKRLFMIEKWRDQWKGNGKLGIAYEVAAYGGAGRLEDEYEKRQGICQLNVKFYKTTPTPNMTPITDIRSLLQQIIITIEDPQNWLSQTFTSIPLEQHNHRISQQTRSHTPTHTSYFYQQPQSRRNKIFTDRHIGLALQGGGCKGVQYVGAYKAILEQQREREMKVRSVIGSSAGGILGLAVCCGLPTERIVRICIEILSKIASNDQKYPTLDDKANQLVQTYLAELHTLLSSLQIFDIKIQQSITSIFTDVQFQLKLKQLITEITNSQVGKLFTDHQNGKLNLLGLLEAGLMSGEKVCEIAVECLKYLLIKKKEDTELKEKINSSLYELSQRLTQDSVLSKQDTTLLLSLTMSQLYQLTGIQFTCTATDITNHTLRFLNQKTTPDLPVSKAVQMTGSFPIAFEAQVWKPEWGKYYIHYEGVRREVDVVGCRFTDGATLANFPVKYLDNQDMRPMYFSHKKTDKTFIYGIGFATEKVQRTPAKMQRISKIIKQMSAIAKKKVSIPDALWSWLKSKLFPSSAPQPQQTSVTISQLLSLRSKIPLIGFLIDIMETFTFSKDNLIEECFAQMSYETKATRLYRKLVEERPQISNQERLEIMNGIAKQIERKLIWEIEGRDTLEMFLAKLEFIKNGPRYRVMDESYLCYLEKILYYTIQDFLYYLLKSQPQPTQQAIFTKFLQKIHQIIPQQHSPQFSHNHHKTNPKQFLVYLLQQLFKIRKEKIFVHCDVEGDFQMLRKVCGVIEGFCMDGQMREYVSKALQQARKAQRFLVEDIIKNLEKLTNPQTKNQKQQVRSIIQSTTKLQYLTMTLPISQITHCLHFLQSVSLPQFALSYEEIRRQDALKSYIRKRIANELKDEKAIIEYPQGTCVPEVGENGEKEREKGLHIVIQSAPLSELYLHWYIMNVKRIAFQCNQNNRRQKQKLQQQNKANTVFEVKKLRISAITITGYQSLIAFLHASDLSDEEIEEEVWKIRGLVQIKKQDAKKKMQRSDWIKMTPIILRQLYQSSIQSQKDIYTYVQQDLRTSVKQFDKLHQSITTAFQTITLTKQQLLQEIEISLNYVMKILSELEKQNTSSELAIKSLIESLALNTPNIRAADKMHVHCEALGEMCAFFFRKYKEIVKFVALNSPSLIDNVMKSVEPGERNLVWLAAVIPNLISLDEIKEFVSRILDRLKLKQNTTLLQFHTSSSKKVQLNFSVVEESIVAIINHITRPNMPILDAILATSAIPEFSKPVLDREEWRYKFDGDYQKRKLEAYFGMPKIPYKFLYSSSAITTMPLDLLENNQFKKRINDKNAKQQIFLIFSFQDFPITNINSLMLAPTENQQNEYKFTITKLTIAEIITHFVSFSALIAKKFGINLQMVKQKQNIEGLKLIKNLSPVTSKINLIKLYFASHDNLIKDLYKEYLVLMPIRFNTLDFDVIAKKRKSEAEPEELSDLAEDAIMQACYVVKEKLENRFAGEDRVKLSQAGESWGRVIGKELFEKPGERVLYFRVETISIDKQEQNQNQKLKIRFLSMLNTSRELYQRYFIYQKTPQSTFKKIKKQSLIIEQSPANSGIIQLKVQYPYKSQVNSRYFILNFKELFRLAKEIGEKDEENKEKARFGLVYQLQFDRIYCQYNSNQELKPVKQYLQDYMNGSLVQKSSGTGKFTPKYEQTRTQIAIKSNIKDTIFQSIACTTCIHPFTLTKSPTSTSTTSTSTGTILQCPTSPSHPSYPLSQKYTLQYTQSQDDLECLLGHRLEKMGSGGKEDRDGAVGQFGEQCDLCGKGSFKTLWKDEGCGVRVCDKCRIGAVSVGNRR